MAYLLTRRRLAYYIAGLSIVPSGCVEIGGTTTKDIEIQNTTSNRHEVTIVSSGDFEERRRSSVVDPEASVIFSDMVPELDYEHEFEIRIRFDDRSQFVETYRFDESMRSEGSLVFRITTNGVERAE